MSSHDHELHRLTEQIKKLTEEQKRINLRVLQSRREEQAELDYVRRRFSAVIHQLEEKQQRLNKEMERRERELHILQKRISNEVEEDGDDQSSSLYRRHLRRT